MITLLMVIRIFFFYKKLLNLIFKKDDYAIKVFKYQRYRTFFIHPIQHENMFEGMKYVQYEPYLRKGNFQIFKKKNLNFSTNF